MRVLIATAKTQGQRKNDFAFVPEGELVTLPVVECDREHVDGRCGCKRTVVGLESRKATTTFMVAEDPDMTLPEMERRVRASLEAAGFLSQGDRSHEAWRLVRAAAGDAVRIAARFPAGAVLERRGRAVQRRIDRGAIH